MQSSADLVASKEGEKGSSNAGKTSTRKRKPEATRWTQEQLEYADGVLNGDRCCVCHEELFDTDDCFECNQKGKKPGVRSCERVYHKQCILGSEIKHAFVEKDLQSSTSSTWTTPVPWQCPVCRDYCMKCTPISKFKPSDTFYKCKLCGGEFHQSHWETNSDKQCIFCKIDM